MAETRPGERRRRPRGAVRDGLVSAGLELARTGGPEAVVLREATRMVGVVPNAAYRHYANRAALLMAVRGAALASMAIAMEAELAALTAQADLASFARARLRAVGAGYLRFAHAEPGLFRTAFSVDDEIHRTAEAGSAGESGLSPFQLLGAALDDLVSAGVLPVSRRMGAEYLAWSAVHGLAMLTLDGPLRRLSAAESCIVGHHLLDMVERGLP